MFQKFLVQVCGFDFLMIKLAIVYQHVEQHPVQLLWSPESCKGRKVQNTFCCCDILVGKKMLQMSFTS